MDKPDIAALIADRDAKRAEWDALTDAAHLADAAADDAYDAYLDAHDAYYDAINNE